MRITQTLTPGATLPADREGPLTLDGRESIVFYRGTYGIFIDAADAQLCLQNWQLHGVWAFSRVGRFLQALPALWGFCK